MKTIRFPGLVVCLSILLAGNGALLAKNETAAASGKEVTVKKTILSRKVEHVFEPARIFKPNDTFALIVYLNEAKVGTRVKGIWTLVQARALKNVMLLEKEMELTQDAMSVKEPNRFNLVLEHDTPYPPGDYKVEVYLNDKLAKTVEFKVT